MSLSPRSSDGAAGCELAEEELRRAHDKLELRVRERTREPAITNASLLAEIAERERAEAALVDAEQRAREKSALLKSILESPEGVVIFSLDANYRYTVFTRAHQETIKRIWGAEIAIGMNMLDIIKNPDDRERAKRNFDRALTGETLVEEEEYGDPALSRTFYENRYSPVRDADGGITGVTVFVIDITKRKDALERAEEATAAKSEFLAKMTHELRTPLSGLLGFAELLFDTPLNDDQEAYAKTIKNSGEHLLSIINDVLDLSSIENGRLTIQNSWFSLAELVEITVLPIRKSAIAKGLGFRCEMDPGLPERIVGDERRIRQILINLLGNAVKFTSSGSVALHIMASSAEKQPSLNFSVEDTGSGIAPESLSNLFKLFTQADSTISQKFGGTGLGLAISKQLADAMKGSISVDSTPGKGSTFIFRLPLREADYPKDEQEIAP